MAASARGTKRGAQWSKRDTTEAAGTFRAVSANETITVECTGTRDSVDASLRRGKPRHEVLITILAVVVSVVAAVALVVFVVSLFSRGPFQIFEHGVFWNSALGLLGSWGRLFFQF